MQVGTGRELEFEGGLWLQVFPSPFCRPSS